MASGRTQASLKSVGDLPGSFGRSGRQARSMLTETALKGPEERPALASDARARSANTSKSCKSLPGSSDDALLINASRAFCNIRGRRTARSELQIQKFEPPHAEQRERGTSTNFGFRTLVRRFCRRQGRL